MATTRLVLCVATIAASFSAQYFFARNSALLSGLGVSPPQGQCVFDRAPGARAGTLRLPPPGDIFTEYAALRTDDSTLLFFLLPGLLHDPAAPLERLRASFPRAETTLVYPFLRQDEAWIGAYAHKSLTSDWRDPPMWLAQRGGETCTGNLHTNVSLLKAQWGDKARLLPLALTGGSASSVSAGLMAAAGLDAAKLAVLGADLAPPPYDLFSLPREFLAFCRAWHALRLPPVPPGSLEPWTTQAALFTREAGYAGDFSPLFSPEARVGLVAAYAESNAALARELGLPSLFPNVRPDVQPDAQPGVRPEPEWEYFPGLTEESAFRVAERLDRDFAAARMAEFDATPVRYLNRGQRFCRQALHDALDTPAVIAPPARRQAEPKLSVLTLSYNQAPYIAECIESVMAQRTAFPFRHIIADDASNDGTQDVILDYAARYPHIVPIFQKERSYGVRNVYTLFDMARTQYAALCDGDDYFSDPDKLQSQVDFLEEHEDAALCFHRVRIVYEDGSGREGVFPDDILLPGGVRPLYTLRDLFVRNIIQTNTVMYRWRFTQGLPEWFRADLTPGDWYWHMLHAEMGRIGFIDKVMGVYRKHEKGHYYLADVEKQQHRRNVGMKELAFYDAVNTHFKRQFEPMIMDLADDLFADCLRYGAETGDDSAIEAMLERYPHFGRHFWASLKKARKGGV